jgi:hypothetical protein
MKMKKDDVMMATAVIILLFSSMIQWTVQSWLALAGVIILLMAWYFKK